ncbi:MAG: prolyl oligopeptidase family serine peptidase [Gemmatimonadales bacterium]
MSVERGSVRVIVARPLVRVFAILLACGGALSAQPVAPQRLTRESVTLSDGSVLRYGLSLPEGYDASAEEPRPLVLVLHPGTRGEYYGASFMQSIVEPGLRAWNAVMVAPDVQDRSWSTPRSERTLVELVERIIEEHAIDRARVLVTGFSMGGAGTWYLAARHPELFTGAIVMAGSPGRDDAARISIPIYLIHSPDDEVVPFSAAEGAYYALAERKHAVEMRVLPGLSHGMMGAYVPSLRLAGGWMMERWLGDRR